MGVAGEEQARRLPRGSHGIPADVVARNQRERLVAAIAEECAEVGYAEATVAAVAKRAGVSSLTFYKVRLHITRRAPEARWVCGRSIVREQGVRGYRPNAGVEIGRERHAILETHMARHDAVIAFCAPPPRKRLERLAAQHHWPKLVLRDIPAT